MGDELRSKLKQLVEETDKGLVEIAKELGIGHTTLKLRMAENGLKIKRVLVESSMEATR